MNFFTVNLIAAIIPLLTGFVWYNPKVFGTAWMKAAEVTEEKAKGANMLMVFGLTYILSFLFAVGIDFTVIHQFHLLSIVANDKPGSPAYDWFLKSLSTYGSNFRTFKHGAFHGVEFGILIILPLTAVNALFERRGFKYILINWGFWMLNAVLMGAFICHFMPLTAEMFTKHS